MGLMKSIRATFPERLIVPEHTDLSLETNQVLYQHSVNLTMGLMKGIRATLPERLIVPEHTDLSLETNQVLYQHSATFPGRLIVPEHTDLSLETNQVLYQHSLVLSGYNLKRLKIPATRVTHNSQSSIDISKPNFRKVCSGLDYLTTLRNCALRVDFKCPEIRVKQRLVNQRTMEQLRNTLAAQD
ncbi:hypothetical protein J6590_067973 [Homalodisca vitripennis]|nr:hypothetical protein J6590_067973 [Homalodisca vitripennis]